MAERWIDWIEPFGPENQPVYMRVPESTAVAVSKTIAASKGPHHGNKKRTRSQVVTRRLQLKQRSFGPVTGPDAPLPA